MKRVARIFALMLIVLTVSCGSPRRAQKNMAGQVANDNAEIAEGRKIFRSMCQKCHPDGEAGVGPALNNLHLPGFVFRYRVRSRSILLWMGHMPSFNGSEISSGEMKSLVRFLKDLEKKDDLNSELTARK